MVRVKPKSKQPSVIKQPDGSFVVAVHAAPADGQANAAVIKALAEHFHIAPSQIRIKTGATSRRKIVEIE